MYRTSLAAQWLRLCAPNAGGTGSVPGQGAKIPACHMAKKEKNDNNKVRRLKKKKKNVYVFTLCIIYLYNYIHAHIYYIHTCKHMFVYIVCLSL